MLSFPESANCPAMSPTVGHMNPMERWHPCCGTFVECIMFTVLQSVEYTIEVYQSRSSMFCVPPLAYFRCGLLLLLQPRAIIFCSHTWSTCFTHQFESDHFSLSCFQYMLTMLLLGFQCEAKKLLMHSVGSRCTLQCSFSLHCSVMHAPPLSGWYLSSMLLARPFYFFLHGLVVIFSTLFYHVFYMVVFLEVWTLSLCKRLQAVSFLATLLSICCSCILMSSLCRWVAVVPLLQLRIRTRFPLTALVIM